VISIGYDAVNRATQVSGNLAGQQKTYVNQVSYAAQGGASVYWYGNNVARTYGYNSRLQTSSLWDAVNNNPYNFLFIQNPIDWGGNTNNGTLHSIALYEGGPDQSANLQHFTQTFSHDSLNRLQTASDSGGWSRTYNYDPYGNVWVSGWSGLAPQGPTNNVFSPLTNRRTDSLAAYDAAGNQTLVGGDTIGYDAENRQVTAKEPPATGGGTETYVYDGSGQRVEKMGPSGATEVYVYDAFGRLAAEYSNTAPAAAPCTTCYLSYDYLGTVRLVTDQSAKVIARHDYTPFGEEVPAGVAGRSSQWGSGADNIGQKFTGQYRDQETGLDYFNARYFSAVQGRFDSADPAALFVSNPLNPQSWNQYAYAFNNPLSFVDPTGMETAIYQWGNCYAYTYDWYTEGEDGSTTVHNSTETFGDCSGTGRQVEPDLQMREAATRTVAQVVRNAIALGRLNQCEGLANYSDAAAQILGTGSGVDTAMAFLTPNSAPGQSLLGVQAAGKGLGTEGSASGFSSEYQNTYPDNPITGWNGDQTHHFAGFFQLGFSHPEGAVLSFSAAFEAAESLFHTLTGHPESVNWGDIRLGGAAGQIAQGMANGSLAPGQIGAAIRSQVCGN
jgi:RHS repeat-associated protein